MLLKVDREKRLERCGERAPLIAKVAEVYGWSKLWEAALDLADAMSHHGRGNHPCHLCDAAPLEEQSVLEHILCTHWEELHLTSRMDPEMLLNMLNDMQLEVLSLIISIAFCICTSCVLFCYLSIYLYMYTPCSLGLYPRNFDFR